LALHSNGKAEIYNIFSSFINPKLRNKKNRKGAERAVETAPSAALPSYGGMIAYGVRY
jgi:hypothetical protein